MGLVAHFATLFLKKNFKKVTLTQDDFAKNFYLIWFDNCKNEINWSNAMNFPS